MSKICQFCEMSKKINSSVSSTTKDDYPEEYLPDTRERPRKPMKYTQEIEFKIHPNSKIWYFGSKPTDLIKNQENLNKFGSIMSYKDAYDTYLNSGIAESDKSGNVKVYLDCPSTYTGLDGKIYYKHFHYIYLNKISDSWSKTIQTKLIFCKVNKGTVNKILKEKIPIPIVNALPKSEKFNIPGTLRIPYNLKTDKIDLILEVYGKMRKNMPIIIYGKDKDCEYKEKLINKMVKLGYTNIYQYNN